MFNCPNYYFYMKKYNPANSVPSKQPQCPTSLSVVLFFYAILLRVRLDPLTGQAIAQLALLGKERRLVAQLKTCFARQPGLGRQGKAWQLRRADSALPHGQGERAGERKASGDGANEIFFGASARLTSLLWYLKPGSFHELFPHLFVLFLRNSLPT